MRYPIYKFLMTRSKHMYDMLPYGRDMIDNLPRRNCDFTESTWRFLITQSVDLALRMYGSLALDTATNEIHTMLADYKCWRSGIKTYYIDERILKFVYDAHFDIDHATLTRAMKKYDEVFSFAFPENARLDGVKLHPTLMCYWERNQYANVVKDLTNGAITPNFEYDEMVSMYVRQDDGTNLYARHGNEEHVRKCFDDEMNDARAFESAEEIKRLHVHMRLVYGLLVYMLVFDDTIHAGFPQQMAQREQRHARNERGEYHHIVLPAQFRNAPVPHFRHGHFRTLRHERYKREPDGSAKVIYVNGMFVSKRNVSPYAIEETTTCEFTK